MIESLTNAKVKYAFKLKQKKYREMEGAFLVEGEHLLEEALKTGYARQVFSTDERSYENVECYQVSEDVMRKLSELGESEGVIAVCQKTIQKPLSDRILILDQLQDPGNMGTLIRTAAAFGFNTVIAENSVDFYNEKVIRGSQGAVFHVDLVETDIKAFIKRHPDYHFIGTDVVVGLDLRDADFSFEKLAIILGNEGSGMRDDVKELVSTQVNIPMLSTESLNVGVAGGILMYESFRRK